MIQPVTDPKLLDQLNATTSSEPSEVSDPDVLAKLNGTAPTDYGDIAKSAAVGGARGIAQLPGAVVDIPALAAGEIGHRLGGDFGKWLESKAQETLSGNNWLPSSALIGKGLDAAGVNYQPQTPGGQTAFNIGNAAGPAVAAVAASPFTGGGSLAELPMVAARYGSAALAGNAAAHVAGNVAEKIAPTDPYLQGLAQVGGGMVGGSVGARPFTPARTPASFAATGVNPAVVSDLGAGATPGAKFASWALQKVPGAKGVLQGGVRDQQNSVGDYVESNLNPSREPIDNFSAGMGVSNTASSIEQRLVGAEKAKWSDFDASSPGSVPAASGAQAAIAPMQQALSEIGSNGRPEVVSDLNRFIKVLNDPSLTLQQMKNLRGEIYDKMPDSGAMRPYYSRAYDGVSQGLGQVAQQGGPGVFQAWQDATQATKARAAAQSDILNQLTDRTAAPIAARLLNNPDLLGQLFKHSTPSEWAQISRSLAMARAGNAGEFSMDALARSWSRTPQATKDLLMQDPNVNSTMSNVMSVYGQTEGGRGFAGAGTGMGQGHGLGMGVGMAAVAGEHIGDLLHDPSMLLSPHALMGLGAGAAGLGAATGMAKLATTFPNAAARMASKNPIGGAVGMGEGDQMSIPPFYTPPAPEQAHDHNDVNNPSADSYRQWINDPQSRPQVMQFIGSKLGPQVASQLQGLDDQGFAAAVMGLSSQPQYRLKLNPPAQ